MRHLLGFAILFLLPAGVGAAPAGGTGFLVIAPDRGFAGNEETREAFADYRGDFKAALAIIGQGGTERFLEEGLDSLSREGAEEIVILPLFHSQKHPMHRKAVRLLGTLQKTKRHLTLLLDETFGSHYLSEEILADRIAALSRDPAREFLILAGQGSDESAPPLPPGFRRSGTVMVTGIALYDGPIGRPDLDPLRGKITALLKEAQTAGLRPVVVPFGLTTKLDGMMAFPSYLNLLIQGSDAAFDGRDWTPHPNIALWLKQRSNARSPVTAKDLGVVYMPHGATHLWNTTMLEALGDIPQRYKIEPAFSMGDPAAIARAIAKLEKRGVSAITVLRVFSLENSFKEGIEEALGLRRPDASAHHHHGPARRIRTGSALHTSGGIGDSPRFALALLDRVLALSNSPSQETVILVGHGGGDDETQKEWDRHLNSLTAQLRELAVKRGKGFRGFQHATWREDWPEYREEAVRDVREKVRKASIDGRVIVVPARTTSGGPGRELLKGLDVSYDGEGFAPHPAYIAWIQEEIDAALTDFRAQRLRGLTPLNEGI